MHPPFLHAAAFALAASLGFTSLPGAAARPESSATTRTFSFTYKVTVPKPPDSAKHLDAWVPLPLQDDLQRVGGLHASATMSGHDVPLEQTTDSQYGNRMVHVGVNHPTDDLVIQWTATITRSEDIGQGRGPMNPRFLQPDHLVPLEGKATDLAHELGLNDTHTAMSARAHAAYENVLTTMQYDKIAEGWGKGDFLRACSVGKGNCTDFHAKFTGIARAGGIPVRFTMGIPLSTDASGTAGGYHCWAHWRDGRHWRPVDISEAQKIAAKDHEKAEWFFGHLDADRLALTIGRDLTLAPKQAGPPLLFFAYPYVEVDGVEAVDPNAKADRSFTWKAS